MITLKLLLMIIFIGELSTAATISEVTTSTYTNKDFKGLCTTHNEKEEFANTNICQSLSELMQKKECMTSGEGIPPADLINEIRLRILGETQKLKKNKQAVGRDGQDRMQSGISTPGNCSAWSEAAKNKEKFDSLFKQVLMAMAIQQSKLNPLYNVQPGNTSNPDDRRGIYDLVTTEMDKKKYSCGCQNINTQKSGGTITGPSPGSRDPHHSIVCGAYMAMYHIAQDGTLFGGTTKDKKDKLQGAAVIFPSLVSNVDDQGNERNQKLKQLNEKLEFYCEKLQNPNGTLRDFDNNVQAAPSSK